MTNNAATPVALLLTEAKALIADEKHWCKNTAARDINGEKIDVFSPDAVCFCSYGALTRATTRRKGFDYNVSTEATNSLNDASYFLYGKKLVSINDATTTTHEDMMKVWDLAIEKSRQ